MQFSWAVVVTRRCRLVVFERPAVIDKTGWGAQRHTTSHDAGMIDTADLLGIISYLAAYPEWPHRQCVGLAFRRSHDRGWLSAAIKSCDLQPSPQCRVQYAELRGTALCRGGVQPVNWIYRLWRRLYVPSLCIWDEALWCCADEALWYLWGWGFLVLVGMRLCDAVQMRLCCACGDEASWCLWGWECN